MTGHAVGYKDYFFVDTLILSFFSLAPLIKALSSAVGVVRILSSSVWMAMLTEKRGVLLGLKVGSID